MVIFKFTTHTANERTLKCTSYVMMHSLRSCCNDHGEWMGGNERAKKKMYSKLFESFHLLRYSPYWTESSKDQRIWPTLRTWNSYMLFCEHSQTFVRNTQVDREALAGFVQWADTNGNFVQKFINLWVRAACPECWNTVGHMLSHSKLTCLNRVILNCINTAPDPQCSKRC